MRPLSPHLTDMKRPKHLEPPKYLSPSPPVPEPEKVQEANAPYGEKDRPDPTRYGDWEKKGIAWDF
ncbi:MAG: DUF1674 domain-containing protein [Sphingomonas sp.]|nr:DUF1674 domain-containing protein [Sphingomonas sp.]